MSRHEAIRRFPAKRIIQELKEKGVIVRFSSFRRVLEETPETYKNIENVVNILDNLGISKKIARLKLIAVIKEG